MATNSKVFVSPGVYTSEVDLSFVSQSVGVTTLGIVGETLKGPAFEPIFIRNFDEFSTFFGESSPEKFVNTQIPKYEAAYIAKSYLQQSNQLFVTRVLGLSGYDAGPSWSIVTKANVDPSTIDRVCITTATTNCDIICVDYQDTDFLIPFTGCTTSTDSISFDLTQFPPSLLSKLNLPFQQFNGDVSTINNYMESQVFNVILTPSTSGSSIYYYGATPGTFYSANTANGYSSRTDVFEVSNMNSDLINYSDTSNDAWYYAMFDNIGGGQYTGSSFYNYITGLTETSSSSNCATLYNFGIYGHVTSGKTVTGFEGNNYSNGTNIPTTTLTGQGSGLTLDILTDGNGITGVTINKAGSGYDLGDTVIVSQPGSDDDAVVVISGISSTSGCINYNTKNIKVTLPNNVIFTGNTLLTPYFSSCTSNVKVGNVTQVSKLSATTFSANCTTYTVTSDDNSEVTNWNVCVDYEDVCNPSTTCNVGVPDEGKITKCYSGTVVGKQVEYVGESYKDFDDLVVATFRSRGLATYGSDDGAVYEVSGLTHVKLDMSGVYSGVTKNPFSTFVIKATGRTGTNYSFETSLSNSDSRYISKIFGASNFSKDRVSVPLFVEERYQTLLNYGWRKGYVRGLSTELVALPDARQSSDPSSIGFYLEKYQTPETPWLVSELRGNKVYNLFKFITISDGTAANTEVKVSIANISFNNGTFDILVRDFFDTDSAPQVIEKFTNCSLNPNENNYVAKKVGTLDGEYQLNSKYIMVEVNYEAPIDALPCGFEGYQTRTYSGYRSPYPLFKTKYDYPGEITYNPPFGLSSGADNPRVSSGDNVRRTYLGISDTLGYDIDFLLYKGKQLPLNICDAQTGPAWGTKTKGFHMDKRASGITFNNVNYEKVLDPENPNKYIMSAITVVTPKFFVGSGDFSSDPTDENNPYYKLFARKFTLSFQGGFDGWDIYRESRTNTDRYGLGKTGYLKGACPDFRYPNATGWGAFKQISIDGDTSVEWANTDYYAYLLGQRTFSNPEAVNINVFVTPGIDYNNNSNLVEYAIDMIENDRADSIYITTTPDYQMFTSVVGDPADIIYPQEAVDILEGTGIDSNYTATYYPWVLTRDSVNNTQIYLPPTAEVTRNLALTDNIAFPWFAAAGYTRGIVNAIKARKKLTQEDRDILYKGRINPIATFSDVGTVIWGNKTLQIRESALDRINVRRLLLQARKLISAVSVRLLFEQNDQKVRQDFLDAVNPILDAIRRDRGLYDFRVTVSSDTADLDRNQMTGKIYIKPTKSLEFIDITFYITPTGASFENI